MGTKVKWTDAQLINSLESRLKYGDYGPKGMHFPKRVLQKFFNRSIKPAEDWFQYLQSADKGANQINFDWRHENPTRPTTKEFPYISLHHERFDKMVKPHAEKARTFIDVGCGGGDKLARVKELWPHLEVYGVEHDPAMAIWASLYGDVVYCEDAFDINYHMFDIIYAYWPIQNRDLMNALIHQILREKRKNSVFLLAGFGGTGLEPVTKWP
jgi:SAM-dependent methyltransferase